MTRHSAFLPHRLLPYRQYSLFLICLMSLVSFRASDDPTYKMQLDQWHQRRIAALKSESGWLNLAGLFWLKEGANTVGTASGYDVAFPADPAPAQLGVFRLQNGSVVFEAAPGAGITADGQPMLTPAMVFSPDMPKPVMLQYNSLKWFIIKRGNRFGVRLRDLQSPLLRDFHGVDRYPTDETWRVVARLEKSTEAKTMAITDVLGLTSQQPLAGTLTFTQAGKVYRLDAVDEGEKLFVLFTDPTNGAETYGSGRFLYVDKPQADGRTIIDFNQAINPPCAFTPYATCPLPPKQNRIPVRITAGEKTYGDH